jgi:N-acylneuraminate cytidylyltransferase
MRTVAVIPVKANSERCPGKNLRWFADGQSLCGHFFSKFAYRDMFDEVYVDTDSRVIAGCAENYGLSVLERTPGLEQGHVTGNELILDHFNRLPDADVIFQMHVTAPLLSIDTIEKAVTTLIEEEAYDSIMTGTLDRHWYWYDDEPINFDYGTVMRSQDLMAVFKEAGGLYGIFRQPALSTGGRCGHYPCHLTIPEIEGTDIDTELDFVLAQTSWNYYVNKEDDYEDC